MGTLEVSPFSLIREPARSHQRERLAALARVGSAIAATGQKPEGNDAVGFLDRDDLIDLVLCLKYCRSLAFEDLSARSLFVIKGVDGNDYLLQIAAAARGFDVFAGSASIYHISDRQDPARFETYYQGTADLAEHFAVPDQAVEQAFLAGLRRIVAFIRQEQGRVVGRQRGSAGDGGESGAAACEDRLSLGSGAVANPAISAASFAAYAAGVLGSAASMAWAVGPGWLGFVAAFVPASVVVAWAVAPHA